MNQATIDIGVLLGITLDLASEVQEEMNLDFSECSQSEFEDEAYRTYVWLFHQSPPTC